VWGRVVKIIHTKGHLGLKRIDSSTLLLKIIKKMNDEKIKEKGKKSKKR
jgi:hypothetical protein